MAGVREAAYKTRNPDHTRRLRPPTLVAFYARLATQYPRRKYRKCLRPFRRPPAVGPAKTEFTGCFCGWSGCACRPGDQLLIPSRTGNTDSLGPHVRGCWFLLSAILTRTQAEVSRFHTLRVVNSLTGQRLLAKGQHCRWYSLTSRKSPPIASRGRRGKEYAAGGVATCLSPCPSLCGHLLIVP